MKIINIYPDILYAVQFEGKDTDELTEAFELWENLDYLVDFFQRYESFLQSDFWITASEKPLTPDEAAKKAIREVGSSKRIWSRSSFIIKIVCHKVSPKLLYYCKGRYKIRSYYTTIART